MAMRYTSTPNLETMHYPQCMYNIKQGSKTYLGILGSSSNIISMLDIRQGPALNIGDQLSRINRPQTTSPHRYLSDPCLSAQLTLNTRLFCSQNILFLRSSFLTLLVFLHLLARCGTQIFNTLNILNFLFL